MTTPVSGSDPYADSGGSGRDVRPAVPGWSAGQDWYTGPVYDDTGWHIDLSNVNWAGNASTASKTRTRGGPKATTTPATARGTTATIVRPGTGPLGPPSA